MAITNQQFQALSIDAKAGMTFNLLRRVDLLEMANSILRRETKNLRLRCDVLERAAKKKEAKHAKSETI